MSDLEFEYILGQVWKYRQIKQEVRERGSKRANATTEKQRQAILEKGRKKGREIFFKAIVNTSDTLRASTT